jgi:hypothetical protein
MGWLAGEGQQTKMELVHQYLTGLRFRRRIEAIVERFSDMQADLDRERKATMRLWQSAKNKFAASSNPRQGSVATCKALPAELRKKSKGGPAATQCTRT